MHKIWEEVLESGALTKCDSNVTYNFVNAELGGRVIEIDVLNTNIPDTISVRVDAERYYELLDTDVLQEQTADDINRIIRLLERLLCE